MRQADGSFRDEGKDEMNIKFEIVWLAVVVIIVVIALANAAREWMQWGWGG
jgi:hypothetical protein